MQLACEHSGSALSRGRVAVISQLRAFIKLALGASSWSPSTKINRLAACYQDTRLSVYVINFQFSFLPRRRQPRIDSDRHDCYLSLGNIGYCWL
jgi:hypothetical protein